MAVFDFVAEYRDMQPAADRDIITARNKAFSKAQADANKLIGRVVDLAYFAYRLPFPAESDARDWFGEILRAEDPTFSIQHDTEEAARIATLVLRQRLGGNYQGTPVLVHAAAFAGKRPTVDNHALSNASRKALEELVRRRGFALKRPEISAGKPGDVSELIKKVDTASNETTVQVLEAMVQDYGNQIKQLVTSANNAVETVFAENRRLAEEVDLLWWHLGGHSYLLDRSLDLIPDVLKPIVIGMDVGEMVTTLPGPFGTFGIIRKALGNKADEPSQLSEAIKALTPDYTRLVSKKPNRYALAPIHGAASDVLVSGTPVSAAQFKRNTGLNYDVKLTAYDLAVQAYHERLLSKLDWI